MDKSVLLINDMAGYGKVALSAMIPVLSKMGVTVYNLPTALVSNTLDYGKFEILDTTDYMENTLKVWNELGFTFNAIATGFIVNSRQAQMVAEYCAKQAAQGVFVLCDPIMGDDGHLYNGMTMDTVADMQKVVAVADCVVPNYTEAALLTGKEYKEELTAQEVKELIDEMRKLGAKSVVITSIYCDGDDIVAGYDATKDNYFSLSYDNIPVRFPGTGDIFSSVMIGELIKEQSLAASVRHAMDVVRRLIEYSLNNKDKYKGIMIEKYDFGGLQLE